MILPLAALLLAPLPALAQDEAAPYRAQLFVCGTGEDAGDGYLELTGVEDEAGGTFTDLRLEWLDRDEKPLWSFPPAGVDAKTAFLFSHSTGPEGYLVTIRFKDAGTDYTLYSLYVPPDPSDENDAGGGAAGLVSARGGSLVADLQCGEAPYEFIPYMQRSMSCDTANPYGPAGCEENEPTRPAPIDISRIGLN